MSTHRFRGMFLFLTSLVMYLGPIKADAQTPPQRSAADMLPSGALGYAETRNPLAALGLADIDGKTVEQFLKLVESDGDKAETQLAAELADLVLTALKGNVGVGLYLPPKSGSEAPTPVVLATADMGASLDKFIEKFNQIPPGPSSIKQVDIAGFKLYTPKDRADGDRVFWGGKDGQFILLACDGSEGAAAGVLSGFGKRDQSIGSSSSYKAARGKLPEIGNGWHLTAYADLESIAKQGVSVSPSSGSEAEMVKAIAAASRVDGLRTFYYQACEKDNLSVSAALLRYDGERTGILKLWDQQPLTDADLKLIPADAYWSWVLNLDLAALWNEGMRVTESVSPEAFNAVQGAVAMTSAFLGFSLTENVLPAFGDTWIFLDSPSHGGFYGLGTVVIVDAKDEKAIHAALARIVELITPLLAQQKITVKLVDGKVGDQPVSYVAVSGVPSPIAPAWAFHDGRWIFGLLPQTVAAAVAGMDAKTGGPRLIDDAKVKSALAEMPKPIHSFGSFDRHYFYHAIYPILTYVSAAIANLSGRSPERLTSLPHLSTLLKGERYSISVTSITPTGAEYRSRGGSMFIPSAESLPAIALMVSILLPSLSRARTLAKRSVSMSNMRSIGQACYIYANENKDKFPPSLDALIEANMLTPGQLISPLQNDDEPAYIYLDGQTVNVPRPDTTVLAYEKPASDEGTAVLFADGHVDFIRSPRWQELIRENYKRLGRDVPPELRE